MLAALGRRAPQGMLAAHGRTAARTWASSSDAAAAAGGVSTTADGAPAADPATALGASVRAGFDAQPQPAAAAAVVAALGSAERDALLAALQVECGAAAGVSGLEPGPADGQGPARPALGSEEAYVDALLQKADVRFPFGSLDRSELKAALGMHSAAQRAQANVSASSVSGRTLALTALATGIPFIGFGFVDNFVMLTAGDEIESLFGARLGLSTLAAAGLGNLVSDVCGLGLADAIEVRARKSRWGRAPRFTAADRGRAAVRLARVTGSLLGVTAGCLAGMCPLLWLT